MERETAITNRAVRYDAKIATNPDALRDIAARLREAIDRGLWTAKSNSAQFALRKLVGEARIDA
jgi:cobaltochelatase CobN